MLWDSQDRFSVIDQWFALNTLVVWIGICCN